MGFPISQYVRQVISQWLNLNIMNPQYVDEQTYTYIVADNHSAADAQYPRGRCLKSRPNHVLWDQNNKMADTDEFKILSWQDFSKL